MHPNGKTIYTARIIPYRGAWVEFEIDINNVMWVMIDRKRKIPATTFLRSFGQHDDEEIVREFFETEQDRAGRLLARAPPRSTDLVEKFIGEEFIEEIIDPKTRQEAGRARAPRSPRS